MKTKHSKVTKLLAIILCMLMVVTVLPLTAFAKYSYEYYVPSGTNFIYQTCLYYSSDSNGKAEDWLRDNGWTHQGGNFNGGDKHNSAYIHFGVTYTQNPALAVRGFAVRDGDEPNAYVAASPVTGAQVTWYKVGSGAITQTPAAGDKVVDLNKGAGGNDLKLYITVDPNAGPPVTEFIMTQNGNGETARNAVLNQGATPAYDQNGGWQDCNEGCGGDYIYCGFKNNAAGVNTSSLRSKITEARGYINTEKYTVASVSNLQSAINNAQSICDYFDNNAGVAPYTQANINSYVDSLNTALNNLQIRVYLDATANGGTYSKTYVDVTSGKSGSATINLGSYAASKSGWTWTGWAESNASTTGSKSSVSVTNGSKFYAVYSKDITMYYVYLDKNTGNVTQVYDTQPIYNNQTQKSFGARKQNSVKIDGVTYTFAGYRDDTNAAAPTFTTGQQQTITLPATSKTVYAVYQADLTLSYDIGSGSGAVASQTGTQYLASDSSKTKSSVSFTVSSSIPTYAGGAFLYWRDSAENHYTGGQTITTEKSVTLRAKYDVNTYDVFFVNDDGTLVNSQEIEYGHDAVAPATNPTKDPDVQYEYVFDGWTGTYTNITKDTTITAKYRTVDHEYALVDKLLPTCEDAGYEVYQCANCLQEKTVDLEALGHIESTAPGYPATCTTDGITDYIFCSRCSDTFQEATVIPKLTHDYQLVEHVDSTCCAKGYDKLECTRCGDVKKENETPISAEHDLIIHSELPATCSDNGHSSYTECRVCGAIITAPTTYISNGHTPVYVAATHATCEDAGESAHYECSICHKVIGEQPIEYEPTDHDFEDLDEKDPTCEDDGRTAGRYCKVCGFIPEGSESTVRPKLGHHWVETGRVEATCSVPGTIYLACDREGCTETKTEAIPCVPHTEAPIADVPATCSKVGSEGGVKCEVCGEIIVEPAVVSKLDHKWTKTNDTIEATCEEAGQTAVYKCDDCGAVKGGTPIAKVPHTYGSWTTVTPATCEGEGLKVRSCKFCGANEQTKVLPAVGHIEIVSKEIPATCEAAGKTAGTVCAICGAQISGGEEIPVTEHDYFTYKTVEATCTEDGYVQEKCAICGDIKEVSHTDALNHLEEIIPAVEATCVKLGSTEGKKCSRCGVILEKPEVVNKVAHTKVDFGGVEATCQSAGMKAGVKCEVCGRIYSEPVEIPAKDHTPDLGTITTEPTCTTEGVLTYKCIDCGTELGTESLGFGAHKLPADYKVEGGAAKFTCPVCGQDIVCNPTEVGLPDEGCENCGLHHKDDSMLFKYNGFYCKLVGFFRSIIKWFQTLGK